MRLVPLAVLLMLASASGCAASNLRHEGSKEPLDRSTSTLLVLHKWSQDLGAYDAATGQRRGIIAVGPVPHEMVLARDQKTLFITNYGVRTYADKDVGASTVSLVDLERGAKAGEIELAPYHRPHGIALGSSRRLYVTVDFPPAVLVLDPSARKIVEAHLLDQSLPHMIAVTTDERVAYVACSGSASVAVVLLDAHEAAPGGTTPPHRDTIAVGGTPMGLSLSGDEKRLYVSNRDGNAIVVIDTKTRSVLRKIEVPGAPARVEVLPGDTTLVTTLIETGDVALVDLATSTVTERIHVGDRAEGLFVDPSGRFVGVSVQGENKVVELSLGAQHITKLLELGTGERPDPMLLVPGHLSFAGGR